MQSHLPESCAIGVPNIAGALIIRRNVPGFSFFRSIVCNQWNDANTATPAHVSAMLLGAVTNWDGPVTDPDLYDAHGKFIVRNDEFGHCAFWCAAKKLSGEEHDDVHLPAKLSAEVRRRIRDERLAFTAIVRFRGRILEGLQASVDAFGM